MDGIFNIRYVLIAADGTKKRTLKEESSSRTPKATDAVTVNGVSYQAEQVIEIEEGVYEVLVK